MITETIIHLIKKNLMTLNVREHFSILPLSNNILNVNQQKMTSIPSK